MANAARAGATLPHRTLPDEIVVWEILVRLPPKSLLRCRAVCRTWRSVTSTHGFLLAHHACQRTLPLLDTCDNYTKGISNSLDIVCFDHRPGVAAPNKLQPVARLIAQTSFHLDAACGDDDISFHPVASCDGLLMFCVEDMDFFICNPATRQYARLPLPPDLKCWVLGMFPHPPTGEYRLLLYSYRRIPDDEPAPGSEVVCHVLALGSGQPPRHIGRPDVITLELDEPYVLCRGGLHWNPLDNDGENKMIAVFDTTSESFQQIQAPVVTYGADLFEMNGMLGMAIFDFEKTVDIWVLQDYESETWVLHRQIELSVADIRVQCDKYDTYARLPFNVVVVSADGELLVLIKFAKWLVQVGRDGKFVATFRRKEFEPTYFQFKQTLVPHNFFPTLEGYVVNAPPFI